MSPAAVVIEALPGMGPALRTKVARAFGSEEAFLAAAAAGDVERLAAVPGIGQRRAVQMVAAAQGTTGSDLLATEALSRLFESIRADLVARAETRAGRNQLQPIGPLPKGRARGDRLAWAEASAKEVTTLDVGAARRLLQDIAPLPDIRPAFEATTVIAVDKAADGKALAEAGLDRWAPVVSARDVDSLRAADVVVYAFTEGGAHIEQADHAVAVPFSTDPAAIVPWAVTQRFRAARAALQAMSALSEMRGAASAAAEALAILAGLPPADAKWDETALAQQAGAELERAMRDAEGRLAEITLTGADLVRAMASTAPKAVLEVYADATRAARAAFWDRTGLDVDPYTEAVPPEVDEEAINGAVHAARRTSACDRFVALQKAAHRLVSLESDIEAELRDHEAFDARQAVGTFVRDHRLVAPDWGSELVVRGARHVALGPDAEPVAYELGRDGARLALLTGANSGGKTTLLETLAQIVALAHAGLPVPAEAAVVPEVDRVVLYRHKAMPGAGAFETFLTQLFALPDGDRILVLADELEAMTELEAAAEILAAFLEDLTDRGALAVLATHMADHVLGALPDRVRSTVRVDGIEATGLDEAGRLVVSRSPRLGVAARSTPELILRRLALHGPDALRGRFAELADRLGRRVKSCEE